MRLLQRIRSTCILCLLLLGITGTVLAQPGVGDRPAPTSFSPASIASLPVNLLPPGARALGLGGAFTAVSDDATAAEANPAGLTILSQPEISIHIRNTDSSAQFFDVDTVVPAFFGGNPQLIKEFEDTSTDVSFASIVKPYDRWVFSAYYQNTLSFNSATPTETINLPDFLDSYVYNNSIDAEVESFGISAAFRFTDFLSLGVSIKSTNMDLQVIDSGLAEDFSDLEFQLADFFGGAPALWAQEFNDTRQETLALNGDDSEITYNIGLLLNPNGRWSAGLVYRLGGEYDIKGTGSFSDSFGCSGTTELAEQCRTIFDQGISTVSFNNALVQTIDLPDTLTLGIAFRPSDTWLFSLDISNVDYSDLPSGRTRALPFQFGLNEIANQFPGRDGALLGAVEDIDDAVNYHFGVEKVIPLSGDFLNVLTLRGGAFTVDDHDGSALLDTDDTHATIGIGAVLANSFQIDFAAEFSDDVDNLVLSGIYRF